MGEFSPGGSQPPPPANAGLTRPRASADALSLTNDSVRAQLQPRGGPRRSPAKAGACAPAASADSNVSVTPRKYVADLRRDFPHELSARIEHQGAAAFFPLATAQRTVAQQRAEAIHRLVADAGWAAAGAQHVREFTFALFWLPNPLTCTYTSLYTVLRQPSPARHPAARRVRVALFEPDREIRWSLIHWLAGFPDFACIAAYESTAALLNGLGHAGPDLLLFDAPPCVPASQQLQAQLATEFPGQIGFPFGIYRDSEHAWHCVTGVDGGYYYRRRRPEQMLEPISALWQAQPPSREGVESQVRHHLQTLFGLRAAVADAFPGLTPRERDVLLGLRRGHTDKSLAAQLGVSVWTVHTHMKNIFAKLGVHTRAEAAARFFEK